MARRHNIQTISWFYDLWQRKLLDLDPPYQRRSVWSQDFKDYFVDTVLLNYPAPALFVFEDITPDGRSVYHVVDGKQRLTTVFEFIRGTFPVSEKSGTAASRGKYFGSLDDDSKKAFWGYQFLVEYVPTDDEKVINGIFDRINRNVAKLTPQELRHARLAGEFISSAENMSAWMTDSMPKNFPRFASQSRNQMKDVEFVSLLMLFLEEGPKSYSQEGLDQAFTDRDTSWENRIDVENSFRNTTQAIKAIIESSEAARELTVSRLRNQADYYALFGAVHALTSTDKLAAPSEAASRLLRFTADIEDDAVRATKSLLAEYFDAARSASNDKGPRETRVNFFKDLLTT